jgi:hypothetical protein
MKKRYYVALGLGVPQQPFRCDPHTLWFLRLVCGHKILVIGEGSTAAEAWADAHGH